MTQDNKMSNGMKIGIVGAGFTGLSAAYYLGKKGHRVTVIEKDSNPGGLAIGFSDKNWNWTLEKHYHHWFTNDKNVLELAKEIQHEVIIKRPKTSVYVDGKIFQFDSPKEVLLFPKLPIIDRFRMGLVIGFLKFNPIWKPLEKINATTFLPKTIGKKSYKLIWEPLFRNKFGPYASDVSLAWFWARIVKRTPSLAYPKGGFLDFANHLVKQIEGQGGEVIFETDVIEISSNKKPQIKFRRIENSKRPGGTRIEKYDIVIKAIRIQEGQPGSEVGGNITESSSDTFRTLSMTFSFSTTYVKFLQFIDSLESNLRLVDFPEVSFNASAAGTTYTYEVTIKTYWLP